MTKHQLLMATLAVAALTCYLALIIYALAQAVQAHADSGPPSTPPTPGLVVNTGGATTGSSPGSSCNARLGLRAQPAAPSGNYTWAQSGDSGWPFGWPGLTFPAPQPAAPAVGCSR